MKKDLNDDIRCDTCSFMIISGRAEKTAKNVHLSGPRGKCFCQHRDAEVASLLVRSGSGRMPGFIAFTKGGSNKPNIKTTPTWCPRKLAIQPKEISKLEAKQDGRLVVLPPPAKFGEPKPECFYNDCSGIWCLGYSHDGDDEPTERCKRCWYCDNGDYADGAEAKTALGGEMQ